MKFDGYTELPAPSDDQIVSKFRALDLSGVPTLSVHPDAAGVDHLNKSVMSSVSYVEEPAGRDVWQRPADTLYRLHKGDCEDFATLKYAMLLMLGFSDDDLRIVVGEIKSIAGNRPHAWCAALVEGRWLALDCMFDFLIPVQDYSNWKPLVTVSRTQASRWGLQFRMSDITEAMS